MSNSKPAKIGIIGDRGHAQRLRQLVELSNAASLTHVFHPKRLPRHPLGCVSLDNLEDCDAVIIAAPTPNHFEYLSKICEWNKYIFLEKPIASNSEDFLKSIDIIRTGKVYINYNYRLSALSYALHDFEEALGKIISFDIFSGNGLSFKRPKNLNWRMTAGADEDIALRTKAIHWIDFLTCKYGQCNKINYQKKVFGPNNIVDTAIVEMDWDSGPNVRIIATYASPLIFKITIVGTNGILVMDSDSIEIRSPRDTFNKDGLFNPPPVKEKKFSESKDFYLDSLVNSFEYFLEIVNSNSIFAPNVFENAILTETIINELVEKEAAALN